MYSAACARWMSVIETIKHNCSVEYKETTCGDTALCETLINLSRPLICVFASFITRKWSYINVIHVTIGGNILSSEYASIQSPSPHLATTEHSNDAEHTSSLADRYRQKRLISAVSMSARRSCAALGQLHLLADWERRYKQAQVR